MGIFNFFRKKAEPPEPAAPKENRALPRWKISAPAKIKWLDKTDYLACEVKDLNMKGLSLVVTEKIPEGCTHAELYFNEKYFFDIEISIIWHKEADCKQIYGIRFTRVRDADKEKIFQMMKENYHNSLRGDLS